MKRDHYPMNECCATVPLIAEPQHKGYDSVRPAERVPEDRRAKRPILAPMAFALLCLAALAWENAGWRDEAVQYQERIEQLEAENARLKGLDLGACTEYRTLPHEDSAVIWACIKNATKL